MLDLGFREKEGLKIPEDIQFEANALTKSSPHREKEYKAFIKKTVDYLEKNDLNKTGFLDFYRISGGMHLDSQANAVYLYLNHK